MSKPQDVTKPVSNSEKFKPKNVQDEQRQGGPDNSTGVDAKRGAEHHLQRKSMNRT